MPRQDNGASRAAGGTILVWDAPVRVFHWLMVLCFAGAYLSAESDEWELLHVSLGYTMAGLVVFRIAWGVVGTRYARFSNFVRGPRVMWRYLRTVLVRPEHHTGHNPAGAWAILAMLGLTLGIAVTGWILYSDPAGEPMEEVHELLANLMLALVIAHIVAVLASSWLHHENLIAAMITGRKHGAPPDGIARPWRALAVLMLAVVLGYWWLQWKYAVATPGTPPTAQRADAGEHDRDD